MTTTLGEHLGDLLALVTAAHVPNADELCAHLEPRATDVSRAGPWLLTPVWAYSVGGADDAFVELDPDGDVPGIHVWNDMNG